MKTVGKMVLTLVALLSIAATASAATDKLIVNNSGGTAMFKVDDSGAATAKSITVQDAAGTKNLFTVQSTGTVSITNATGTLDTDPKLIITDTTGIASLKFTPDGFLNIQGLNKAQINNNVYHNNPGVRPVFVGNRYRGTQAVGGQLPVQLDDKLGTFAFAGYDGSALQSGALLEVFVDGAVSTGSVPQRFSIVTGANPTARAERIVVKSDGKVGIGTSAPKTVLHSTGSTIVGAASSANVDTDLGNNQCNMWINEATNLLTFKCKYSTGTVKSATITLQ